MRDESAIKRDVAYQPGLARVAGPLRQDRLAG